MEVLERSSFKPKKDRLISVGDVYDGHPDSARCVEELRKVKDFVWVLGNHDEFVRSWFRGDWTLADARGEWYEQDLYTTIESYKDKKGKIDKKLMKKHAAFVEKAVLYHIDEENRLYVHAGIDWDHPVDKQPDPGIYFYDRKTYRQYSAQHEEQGTRFPYKDVYIGHTKTIKEYDDAKPVRRANLWNIDTGAGTWGKLTIMDVDTYEYWQSDWSEQPW